MVKHIRCAVVATIGWAILVSSSYAAATGTPSAQPTNAIMVELDSASGAWPSHDQVIGAVSAANNRSAAGVSSAAAAANAAIAARLHNPKSAHYLVTNRIHPEVLAAMDPNDGWHMLHRVIVLIYPDGSSADNAERAIKSDRTVLKVERGQTGHFSSAPNDPLRSNIYSTPAYHDETRYQWAVERLNLVPAWEKVKGTAYVGLLDNGIQLSHPDLQENYRPQLSWHFVWNGNGDDNLDETPFDCDSYRHNFCDPPNPHVAGHG